MRLPVILLSTTLLLSACTPAPPKAESNAKSFTQESSVSYREAFRAISKNIKLCEAGTGLMGNGLDSHAELDTVNKTGLVEVYWVGLTKVSNPENSMFSKKITITGTPNGSRITTSGTNTKQIFLTHKRIKKALAGNNTCNVY